MFLKLESVVPVCGFSSDFSLKIMEGANTGKIIAVSENENENIEIIVNHINEMRT